MSVGEALVAAGYGAPEIVSSPPAGVSMNPATEDEVKPETYRCLSAWAGAERASAAAKAASAVVTSRARTKRNLSRDTANVKSPDNAEVIRTFTKAFNAGDVDALISCCDPRVEFRSKFAAVGGAVYQGHDGVRQWRRDLEEMWGEQIHSELETLYDVGDHILVFTVLHGRGEQSGAEVDLPAAMVVRLSDGLFVDFRGYTHRDDALEDLGVALDDLEPIAP
jgi:ketosteroid isomerase-like protein